MQAALIGTDLVATYASDSQKSSASST